MCGKKCLRCGVSRTELNTGKYSTGKLAGRLLPYCIACWEEKLSIRRKERGLVASGCTKCGKDKFGNKNWCTSCSNTYNADYKIRREFIGPTLPKAKYCPRCGQEKTDETTKRLKSGPKKGEFFPYCVGCRYTSSLSGRVTQLRNSSIARAKKKNIEYDLDDDFILNMFISQENRCNLTGIVFSLDPPKNGQHNNPYSPSIDRIDPKKGYTKDNVRLILSCVNFALSEFGLDLLIEWSKELQKKLG